MNTGLLVTYAYSSAIILKNCGLNLESSHESFWQFLEFMSNAERYRML